MEKPPNAKRGRNKRSKVTHLLVNYSGPSYSDLPRNILENIFLRLSLKRISVCKCVCKTWYSAISDWDFKPQVYPLIHTLGFTAISRMLYLVQSEQDDFELKLDCNCYALEHNPKCSCNVKFKLNTKFKLPLRNLEMIDNDDIDSDEAGRNDGLKLNMKDHKYKIVNSCNGLLCLADPSNNEPMIVCNPITGEFIDLPEERTVDKSETSSSDFGLGFFPMDDDTPKIVCGFGFSPKTNQYKVIRMFTRWTKKWDRGMVAEIHILGTKSWKNLGVFPYYSADDLCWPTYLNGYIYWYYHERHSIVYFDIEKDDFGMFRSPPCDSYRYGMFSFGVLEGEFCITESFSGDHIVFWVMKYSIGKTSWSKMLTICMDDDDRWPWGPYQPIKYLNNGALLMFNCEKHIFVYYNPRNKGYRYLELRGMQSKVEAICHIPSFVSLKDAVPGLNTTVLNVRSRCGQLKLYKEEKGISIFEQIKELVVESDEEFDSE